ncbi:threonine/serine ThrE exporter family protein [Enterococcus sp. AZ126]|uniref:threonine/serine ThrE exporter family protein n=1 Tax=Enterococcus sp. AZ126 TaxID=2774635 RepID=UPI003F2784A6
MVENSTKIETTEGIDEASNDLNIKVLIIYGKLMLESNYGVSEVRSNLIQMMLFMGINSFSFYITPTNLMLINQQTNDVKMLSIQKYSYNFEKMSHIKTKVDAFLTKKITTDELYKEFKQIDKHDYAFPRHVQIFVAGIICGSMYILINKLSMAAFLAFLVGVVGYFCYIILEKYINIKIFSIFLYSTIVSTLAVLLVKNNITQDSFSLTLSCMMPLLPGATLVNAIRDSIDGDYLSGISQASEAINTALMLGLPVAFILTNF